MRRVVNFGRNDDEIGVLHVPPAKARPAGVDFRWYVMDAADVTGATVVGERKASAPCDWAAPCAPADLPEAAVAVATAKEEPVWPLNLITAPAGQINGCGGGCRCGGALVDREGRCRLAAGATACSDERAHANRQSYPHHRPRLADATLFNKFSPAFGAVERTQVDALDIRGKHGRVSVLRGSRVPGRRYAEQRQRGAHARHLLPLVQPGILGRRRFRPSR